MDNVIVPAPQTAAIGGSEINFPFDSVNSAVVGYIKNHWLKFIGIWALISIVLNGCLAIYYYKNGAAQIFDAKDCAGIIIVVLIAYLAILRQKMIHEFMEQFAGANGFTYQQTGQVPDLTGGLFLIGQNQKTEDIIGGQFQNLPLQIFNYSYTVERGMGKERNQTTYSRTILKIGFTAPLPPVALKAKKHDFGGDLFAGLGDASHINTTGDFDNKFELSSGKEFEIEALQIFQPDIMETIAANYAEFSLEFTGQNLFIYAYKLITTKTELQNLFSYAKLLIEKLSPVAQRMSGSVKAMQELQKS